MRRTLRLIVLVTTAVLGALLLTTPASAAPSCAQSWGSTPEYGPASTPTGADLLAVRAGRHTCYDRLVLSLRNGSSALDYTVRYGTVRGVGSGDPVPLRGGAALEISVRADGATYPVGNPRRLVDVAGYRTFRQVAWAGSYEGETVIGLGTRARLPFRTFLLQGPTRHETRLVIDVAHTW